MTKRDFALHSFGCTLGEALILLRLLWIEGVILFSEDWCVFVCYPYRECYGDPEDLPQVTVSGRLITDDKIDLGQV